MAESITDLLNECTVRIKIKSAQNCHNGSGFFVAPNLILTCAHVLCQLQEEEFVEEVYCMATNTIYRAKLKRKNAHPSVDLAILEIEEEIPNQPCVYLGKPCLNSDDNYDYYAFGYPQSFPQGDTMPFNYQGKSFKGTNDKNHLWHKLVDAHVERGASGSPILDLSTGLVCGVLSLHYCNEEKPYSRAVSTESIFYVFPELEELRGKFHCKNQRWAKLIPGLIQKGDVDDLTNNPDYCKAYILDVLRNPETKDNPYLLNQLYIRYNLFFLDSLENLLDKSTLSPIVLKRNQELLIQTALLLEDRSDRILLNLYSILNDVEALSETRLKAKYAINYLSVINLNKAVKEWVNLVGHSTKFPTDKEIYPLINKIREFSKFLSDKEIYNKLFNQTSVKLMSSFLRHETPPILENCLYLFLAIDDKDFYKLVRNSSLKDKFYNYLVNHKMTHHEKK